VYNHRINTHSHQNKRNGRTIKIVRGNRHKISLSDHDKLPKQWLHPAARIIATDNKTEESTPINIYTDGSKSEQGVGAGIAIKRPGTPTVKLMYRMDTRCSNNQAEAFAILKELEYIQTTHTNEEDKAVTVHTDSRTLDSLNNTDIQTFLTEEIRNSARVGNQRMENTVQVDKSPCRGKWKRTSRQVGERSIR
jgi:ribonuclease HI